MTTAPMKADDVIALAASNPDHAWHLLRTIAWQPSARARIRAALEGTTPPAGDAPRTALDHWARAGFER